MHIDMLQNSLLYLMNVRIDLVLHINVNSIFYKTAWIHLISIPCLQVAITLSVICQVLKRMGNRSGTIVGIPLPKSRSVRWTDQPTDSCASGTVSKRLERALAHKSVCNGL